MLDVELLQRICSDADLIDIDFSVWDLSISLLVIADHLGPDADGTRPAFMIHFDGTEMFHWQFCRENNHSASPKARLQWNIYKCEIAQSKSQLRITLAGSAHMPSLVIECRSFRIERVNKMDLDTVNPGWRNYGGGLARPGMTKLAAIWRSR